jgi:L-galactono-1,4-lactone dehydrogenase
VDAAAGRVTLQAGARLEVALDALRAHGWTLQNFSSIKEQQLGGWTQAGCHGTGAALPPVEEQLVSLKLVTPAKGTLLLDRESNNPELFHLAKVGLGALGIVSEVTLQGVRAHALGEQTAVLSADAVAAGHAARLAAHRHVRYMWLPYTDAVVVVTANPLEKCPPGTAATPLAPEAERTAALRALLRKSDPTGADEATLLTMSFADLRDKLLALNPLSSAHVAAVNVAEAAFWRASAGWRVGDSEAILGFECGGEQCVSEVAAPCGTRARPSGADIAFARDTLALIRAGSVPAPCPIEQRWSAASAAPMSPVHSANANDLFTWIGIIMYLPPAGSPSGPDAARRAAVRTAFEAYRAQWMAKVGDRYSAADHWAKIEVPPTEAQLVALRAKLRQRYPVDAFNAARCVFGCVRACGNACGCICADVRVLRSACVRGV